MAKPSSALGAIPPTPSFATTTTTTSPNLGTFARPAKVLDQRRDAQKHPRGGGCRKNKKVSPKKPNNQSPSSSSIFHIPIDFHLSFPDQMKFSHLNNLMQFCNSMGNTSDSHIVNHLIPVVCCGWNWDGDKVPAATRLRASRAGLPWRDGFVGELQRPQLYRTL
ncbi:hypothetical protein ACFX13_011797 [Malus domestica]